MGGGRKKGEVGGRVRRRQKEEEEEEGGERSEEMTGGAQGDIVSMLIETCIHCQQQYLVPHDLMHQFNHEQGQHMNMKKV